MKKLLFSLFLHILILLVIVFLGTDTTGWLLIVAGLSTINISFLIFDLINKNRVNKGSKISTVILGNLNLYLVTITVYLLSNIGFGEKGSFYISFIFFCILAFIISIVKQSFKIEKIKSSEKSYTLNMILFLTTIGLLVVIFYGFAIHKLAGYKNDYTICEYTVGIKNNSVIFNKNIRDKCVENLAAINQDPKICAVIQDDGRKYGCLSNIAQYLGSINVCGQISDQSMQSECISELAKKLNQPSLCEKISNKISNTVYPRDECYFGVGVRNNDVFACEKIEKLNNKYDCIYGAAQELKDPQICEKYVPFEKIEVKNELNNIFATYSKDDCIKYVNSHEFIYSK